MSMAQEMKLPHIKNTKTQGNYASYEIEPLEAGYGMTLGHSLRRVLLFSLPGAAVTAIRIEGVLRESQGIPGVEEEVAEIVLNVKMLRLRSSSPFPVTMRLEVHGSREVTAADIDVPTGIEILTPALHLASLVDEQAHLSMELTVEVGKGYVSAPPEGDRANGAIPVDAVYTPVQKVIYAVEHTRVGQMTNFDKVVLEIWTDGTTSPDDALRLSAEILVSHFTHLASYHPQAVEIESAQPGGLPIPREIYETPIEELHLGVRAYNSLKRSNITKVGHLLTMDEDTFLQLRNFGEKSLLELFDRLKVRAFLPTHDSEVA